MSKGQVYQNERRMFKDKETGIEIVQLSSFPTVNFKFYFHYNEFTPDSETLLFRSYKENNRNSTDNVFKVNVDGTELIQMTDAEGLGSPFFSYDGKWLYYISKGTLHKTDFHTLEDYELGHIEEMSNSGGSGSLTFDGKHFYSGCRLKNGNMGMVYYSTETDEARLIYQSEMITHVQIKPLDGNVIAFQSHYNEEGKNIYLIKPDGSGLKPFDLKHGNGHWMWVADTKKIMCGLNLAYNKQGIVTMGLDDVEPEIIIDDIHYWHPACSNDGKWMVSDSNWPDKGIFLINPRTQKSKLICRTNARIGDGQWSHPHPSISHNGKYIVFNSDMTGTPNVFLAKVPEEFLTELQTF